MQVGQELLSDEQGGSHEAGALQLVLQAHQEAHVQQQRLGRLRRSQGCATLHEPHQASHHDVGQAALLLCLHRRARSGRSVLPDDQGAVRQAYSGGMVLRLRGKAANSSCPGWLRFKPAWSAQRAILFAGATPSAHN